MKKILLFSILILGLSAAAAQAQSLDLKSYFPAPYGAYDRLKLIPQDHTEAQWDINADCSGLGGTGTIIVVDNDPEIRICSDDGSGGAKWTALPGVWTQNTNYIFPTDTDDEIRVGIGTNSPETKLHVKSNSDTVVTIEGAGGAGDIGVKFYEDTGAATPPERASLKFDSNSDLILKNETTNNVKLETGGAGFLTLTDSGYVGINDDTPNAVLEVAGSSGGYLAVSTDDTDSNNGNILDIESDGDVFINMGSGATRSDESQLQIGGPNNSTIAFETANNDIEYNGGDDNTARFVHTGAATGSLEFKNNDVKLAEITNTGMLNVARKLSIGRINDPYNGGADIKHDMTGEIVHDAVEFHIHEKYNRNPGGTGNPEDDVIMVLSDNGTSTGVNDDDFEFIESNTIGVLMPVEDLWKADRNSSDGGLMVLGISDGSGTDPAGLNLVGLVGQDDNPADVTAVEIDGNKIDGSGDLVKMEDDDIVLGINYTSNTTGSEDGTVFLANGTVGVGFDDGEKPNSDVALHVRNTLKIEPRNNPPFSCDSEPRKGILYYDADDHTLCLCNGSSWVGIYDPTGVGCN